MVTLILALTLPHIILAGNLNLKTNTNPHPNQRKYFGAYYDKMLDTYLKVWTPNGRVDWGYFDSPGMNLVQAQDRQAERLSELGRINKDSIVLDLGCGSGVNSIFLAEKYGCRVLGIDISMGMLAMAREQLKRCSPEVQTKVSFYQGTVEDLVDDMQVFTWQAISIYYQSITANRTNYCKNESKIMSISHGLLSITYSQCAAEHQSWAQR